MLGSTLIKRFWVPFLLVGVASCATGGGKTESRRKDETPPASKISSPKESIYIPPSTPEEPASPEVQQRAQEDASFKNTYSNYRKAIATHNKALSDALKPHILKRKEYAISLAEAELRQTSKEYDRDVAKRVIESLEN